MKNLDFWIYIDAYLCLGMCEIKGGEEGRGASFVSLGLLPKEFSALPLDSRGPGGFESPRMQTSTQIC